MNIPLIHSLILKVTMLGMAAGIVVWIGWPGSQHHQGNMPGGGRSIGLSESPSSIAAALDRSRSPSFRVDLNRGTLGELQTLPGIGPSLAARIVQHRTSHGPFHHVEDLKSVKGIGDGRFGRLRRFVKVETSAP